MSMVRSCAGSALAFLLGSTAPWACTLPPFEPVTILRTARDPVLADGRTIRLAGVTPSSVPSEIKPGPAQLSVLTRTPDRWGRIAGVLVPGEGGISESLNLGRLRQGAGFALPADWPSGCFAALRLAEEDARRAGRGVWALDPLLQATDIDALRAHAGRFAIVTGTLRSVRKGRRQVFLNFRTFGSDRFSATVAVSRLDAFAAAGLDLLSLRGQRMELRGVVGAGPSMELQAPEAVVLLRRP